MGDRGINFSSDFKLCTSIKSFHPAPSSTTLLLITWVTQWISRDSFPSTDQAKSLFPLSLYERLLQLLFIESAHLCSNCLQGGGSMFYTSPTNTVLLFCFEQKCVNVDTEFFPDPVNCLMYLLWTVEKDLLIFMPSYFLNKSNLNPGSILRFHSFLTTYIILPKDVSLSIRIIINCMALRQGRKPVEGGLHPLYVCNSRTFRPHTDSMCRCEY